MTTNMKLTRNAAWRHTGFLIRQERDRENDDTAQFSDLFTFEHLNPQTTFCTRLSRRDRMVIGVFFIKRAIFGNR